MTYIEIINNIQKHIIKYKSLQPKATEEQIYTLKYKFKDEYSYNLPEEYCNILRITNGLNFNGLTIWPTQANDNFKESLFEANKDFHDVVSEDYLYFAQWDEIVFVLELKTEYFIALDLKGKVTWEKFDSFEKLIYFALQCAYESFDNDLE